MDFGNLAAELRVAPAVVARIAELLASQGIQVTETEIKAVRKIMRERSLVEPDEAVKSFVANAHAEKARNNTATELGLAAGAKAITHHLIQSTNPLAEQIADEATSALIQNSMAKFYGGVSFKTGAKTTALINQMFAASQGINDSLAESAQFTEDGLKAGLLAAIAESSEGNPAFLLSGSSTNSNNQA